MNQVVADMVDAAAAKINITGIDVSGAAETAHEGGDRLRRGNARRIQRRDGGTAAQNGIVAVEGGPLSIHPVLA